MNDQEKILLKLFASYWDERVQEYDDRVAEASGQDPDEQDGWMEPAYQEVGTTLDVADALVALSRGTPEFQSVLVRLRGALSAVKESMNMLQPARLFDALRSVQGLLEPHRLGDGDQERGPSPRTQGRFM